MNVKGNVSESEKEESANVNERGKENAKGSVIGKEKGANKTFSWRIILISTNCRERDEKITKNVRDVQREKEMEEEIRERKKAEKKAREKEEAYQERLMNWEQREKRKAKEYEKVSCSNH